MVSKTPNKNEDHVYPFVHYSILFPTGFHSVSWADFIFLRELQVPSGSSYCFAVFRKIQM